MRRFNVTGLCIPEYDYMVDIGGKVAQAVKLIDDRCYFTINRARQYGKTTLLAALERALKNRYIVISISFEGLGTESFASSGAFCHCFSVLIGKSLKLTYENDMYEQNRPNDRIDTFMKLSDHITAMCQCKEVVLMIDEVDKVSNNTVFLNFLSMLRNKYLARKSGKDQTFHSVILSGVEGNIYNSPWNIAVDFNIDMAFNPDEIASMLVEYEGDHHTGMDISAVSLEIFTYTGGYPFLVSRVCQYIDNMTNADWSAGGVRSAAQAIVNEKNTLFDDIIKNLENDAELSDTAYKLLILGEVIPFMPYDSIIGFGVIYGFFKKTENGDSLIIANKIFELLLTNYFVSKDLRRKNVITSVLQRDLLTTDGGFDMELCLRKFAGHYFEIYNELDAGFLERHGRLLFLSYLKPLINGQGYYHIESQFTDARRMDVVVDFGRRQFIIELKIWRGEQYRTEAYAQLCAYLAQKNANTGYLLTFDFRKERNKNTIAEWHDFNGFRIFEITV